jgi:6,7-dimethyl-8-ribityllumazine synthase
MTNDHHIAIVYAPYYKEEMDALVRSTVDALTSAGILKENIALYSVPGSFEIPLIAAALAEKKKVDAMIGLGIIIEGETHHARLLADAVTHGMMAIQLKYLIPFAFEVLYVHSMEQVRCRLHKGKEAADAVLHALAQLRKIT